MGCLLSPPVRRLEVSGEEGEGGGEAEGVGQARLGPELLALELFPLAALGLAPGFLIPEAKPSAPLATKAVEVRKAQSGARQDLPPQCPPGNVFS